MLKLRKQMYAWIWRRLKTGEQAKYNFVLIKLTIWMKWTVF